MPPYPITICVIFFGPHTDLCRRFLTNLYRYTPVDRFTLRVGLNAAAPETIELTHATAATYGNVSIHAASKNIFKSPLMSQLFNLKPIESDWIIWFDDDSYPYRRDWLPALALKMEVEPDVDVWGNPFFIEADEAAVEFIRTASWFRGKPFNYLRPSGQISSRPLLTFVEGGFWAARTEVIRHLNWPDPRLVQTEDDYMFGEALRQNGCKLGKCCSGVRINQSERRCPPDTPSSYGSRSEIESPLDHALAASAPDSESG